MRNGLAATLLVMCGFATAAHANVAIWEFTGTVSSVTPGFTPPSFAALGQTVTVDYTIDLGTPLTTIIPGDAYSFSNAVTSEVINNQATNSVVGIDWNPNFLGDINMGFSGRSDGIEFVSFNDHDPALPYESDVASALAVIANAVAIPDSGGMVSLRFDFSGGSVTATPTSFEEISAAPEPGSALILISGLPALALAVRTRKRLGRKLT